MMPPKLTWTDQLQPLVVFGACLLGLSLGALADQVGGAGISTGVALLVQPLLMVMIFLTFLPLSLAQMLGSWTRSKVVAASLGINFGWTPLLAWGLGALFLRDRPDLWVGLILFLVTPCTDWYLVFTALAGGDVPLATALLPLNLGLQIILLPVYLLLLAGALVAIAPGELVGSVGLVLVLPWAIASLTRYLGRRRWGTTWLKSHQARVARAQALSLNLAVVALFAASGTVLTENLGVIGRLLLPIGLFFGLNLALAGQVSRRLGLSYAEYACLSCTTLARNSPLALAIAATAFPDRPLISLTLVVGPLIELPTLTLIAQWLPRQRLAAQDALVQDDDRPGPREG